MLKPEAIVNVVVTEKPQRVFVVVQDQMHVGKWKTVNPGENGVVALDDKSNQRLLNAAMLSWDGQSHFTTTIAELDKRSQGWGVQ